MAFCLLIKFANCPLRLCLSMLRTMPMALINTTSEVEPADINGSGSPVGGIEPVNISYCTYSYITLKTFRLCLHKY